MIRFAQSLVVIGWLSLGPDLVAQAEDWSALMEQACTHRRYGVRLAVSKKVAAAGDRSVEAIRKWQSEGKPMPLLLVSSIASASTRGPKTLALLAFWARDRSFPWRSQALGGLAERKLVGHHELFSMAVKDPSHLCRIQGGRGLWAVAPKGAKGAVSLLLRDSDPRVRVRIAAFLLEQGEDAGLGLLMQALTWEFEFLGDPWGKREAATAAKVLEKDLGEDCDFSTPQARALSIAKLRHHLRDRFPGHDSVEPVIDAAAGWENGLDIRSCRNGDLFIRWNNQGQVALGLLGELREDGLPAVADSMNNLSADQGAARRVHGKITCDYLQLVLSDPLRRWKFAPDALTVQVDKSLRALTLAFEDGDSVQKAKMLRDRLLQFTEESR